MSPPDAMPMPKEVERAIVAYFSAAIDGDTRSAGVALRAAISRYVCEVAERAARAAFDGLSTVLYEGGGMTNARREGIIRAAVEAACGKERP